jgi:hypothetical protein
MKKLLLSILAISLITIIFVACTDDEKAAFEKDVLWTNNNIYGVENKPTQATYITIDKDCNVSVLTNYHYFNDGAKPGEISLIGKDGKKYGPWKASGRVGQGDVKDAYWDVFPNVDLKGGIYEVIDSDSDTWSHNEQSKFCGFSEIRGTWK